MHVIAVRAYAIPEAERAAALARALSLGVQDTRALALAAPPRILAARESAADALAIVDALRRERIDAFMLGPEALAHEDRWFFARSFTIGDIGLELRARDGSAWDLAWDDVVLSLQATAATHSSSTTTTTQKKFSFGRAIMSGGILLTKSVTTRATVESTQKSMLLLVFARGGRVAALAEDELIYEGLGSAKQPTRHGCFRTLVTLLRTRIPGAVHDDRLIARAAQAALLGSMFVPEASLNITTAVLAHALLQRA